ncbi:hypothetical protein MRBLMI12_000457 [Microbacterium sp. LMI12-1-1.1]|uniref:hypothetical protein n=1 Tax=Microbacterium sp. LMI12-1-1.1 TaxID=3135225 RepID=UPI003448C2BF
MSILATLPPLTVTADTATDAARRKLDRTRTGEAKAADIERRHARAMKRGQAATRAGRRAATRD